MTDRPILFSGQMVRAILDGTKTQTRRVVKLDDDLVDKTYTGDLVNYYGDHRLGMAFEGTTLVQPIHYAIGDRLWVRETWQAHSWASDCVTIRYAAQQKTEGFMAQVEQIPYPDGDKNAFKYYAPKGPDYWRPSIHMPRWASRLTLTVTDVRVQRLQDISETDAIAEGCLPFFDESDPSIHKGPNGTEPEMMPLKGPVEDFQRLWNSLNAKRGAGWDANPWVVAITFEARHGNIDRMGDTA